MRPGAAAGSAARAIGQESARRLPETCRLTQRGDGPRRDPRPPYPPRVKPCRLAIISLLNAAAAEERPLYALFALMIPLKIVVAAEAGVDKDEFDETVSGAAVEPGP